MQLVPMLLIFMIKINIYNSIFKNVNINTLWTHYVHKSTKYLDRYLEDKKLFFNSFLKNIIIIYNNYNKKTNIRKFQFYICLLFH